MRTFLAGLLMVVPLLFLGWLYDALPQYHTWIVIGGIGGFVTTCPGCRSAFKGGEAL